MQVSVDKIDELKRKITVTVPSQDIEKDVTKKLSQLQKTVRLPGFRPGKVPTKIIESKYAQDVLFEVSNDAINRSYFKALVDEKIEPATQPNIVPEKMERGSDLVFSAEFEVYPEVKSTDLTGATVVKPVCEITEADVDKTIEKIREQRVAWKDKEGASAEGDKITMDFTGKLDGVEFEGGSAEKFDLVLGKGGFIADFEKGVTGLSQGDEKTIDVSFPDDYPVDNLAGKNTQFDIVVHSVQAPVLPELNEEFIASLGIQDATIDAFKAQVKENMQRELDTRIASKLRGRALDALYEKNDLTIPAEMINQEKKTIAERHKQRLKQQGMDESMIPLNEEEVAKEAKRHATLAIVAREVIKAHSIELDKERVTTELTKMAGSYEDPSSFIEWYRKDNNRMMQIESTVLEQQMVDKLLETATIAEETVVFGEFVQ